MSLQIHGDQATMSATLSRQCPEWPGLPPVKRQLLDYQSLALFVLAREYNRTGARILEIGTGHGGSGWIFSKAAPLAEIVSLTTSPAEIEVASRLWASAGCRNVHAECERSWDRLARTTDRWDVVFVDGDHNQIERDLPWFDRLTEGGLFLCHDYSPQDSRSPSGIVYAELNAMAARLGRPFDVLLIDEHKIGMAGFSRIPAAARPRLIAPSRVLAVRPPALAPGWLKNVGIVCHGRHDADLPRKAAARHVYAELSPSWDLRWPRTLFADSSAVVPWDLVVDGFNLVVAWDLAMPFTPTPTLACEVGTSEERARTAEAFGDLRVPVYDPRLLFVQDSEDGRAWLRAWREDCDACGHPQLAALRALATVKPRLAVLPRIWLAPEPERAAINRQSQTCPGAAARLLRRKG